MPEISYRLRKQWFSQQVQDMPHIRCAGAGRERTFPAHPRGLAGTVKQADAARSVGAPIDAFFVGDLSYSETLASYFPEAKVELFDPSRTRYPISATEIRKNILGNWHYILGAARPFFAKKVLIAGTESCGKTTLTKCLAKLYNTSWSEEVGRYYARDYLGNDETIYTDEDFGRIAHIQYEQDYHALRSANKVCFFDTDATYTDYFSELYMGHRNELVEKYIDHTRYDRLFYLMPDVRWVADGRAAQRRRRPPSHSERPSFANVPGLRFRRQDHHHQRRLQRPSPQSHPTGGRPSHRRPSLRGSAP